MMTFYLIILFTLLIKAAVSNRIDDKGIIPYLEVKALDYFRNDDKARIRHYNNKNNNNNELITHQAYLYIIIDEFKKIPNEEIFQRVDGIDNRNPHFFFHSRKSGGIGLRSGLYNAAQSLEISSYIACNEDSNGKLIPCDITELPNDKLYSIYALNGRWGCVKNIEYLRQHEIIEKNNVEDSPEVVEKDRSNTMEEKLSAENLSSWYSCSTNLREPVARIIDCVEHRLLQQNPEKHGNVTCIGELGVSGLYKILSEGVDDKGRSCLNEPFRVFSGLHDEQQINELGIRYYESRFSVMPTLDHISISTFRKTLFRYSKCIPFISEFPIISAGLLAYKFPSLSSAGAYPISAITTLHKNITNTQNNRQCKGWKGKVSSNQLKLLEHFAAYERVLYDTVVAKVKNAHRQLVADNLIVSAVAEEKGSKIALEELESIMR